VIAAAVQAASGTSLRYEPIAAARENFQTASGSASMSSRT